MTTLSIRLSDSEVAHLRAVKDRTGEPINRQIGRLVTADAARPTDSNLVAHARRELELAGMFSKDADYDGMIAPHVMEIVEKFAGGGHSGFSANLTISLLKELLSYKPLTPLTSDPNEWMDVSEYSGGPMWQSKRSPSVFSRDGGATWYDLDAPSSPEVPE